MDSIAFAILMWKRNSMQNPEELFASISYNIINHTEGDIFNITDLLDQFQVLRTAFSGNSKLTELIHHLIELLKSELNRNPHENLVRILTDGIDILRKFMDNNELTNPEFLYQKIAALMSSSPIGSIPANPQTDSSSVDENRNCESEGSVPTIGGDILNHFLVEADEKIHRAQEIILELENDFENQENIIELFRIFHTIKGECGFLKIASLGELTHHLENILDLIKTGQLKFNSAIIDALLVGIDYSMEILARLKKGEAELFHRVDPDHYWTFR